MLSESDHAGRDSSGNCALRILPIAIEIANGDSALIKHADGGTSSSESASRLGSLASQDAITGSDTIHD